MKKFLFVFCALATLAFCVSCAKEEYEYFGKIHGTVTDFNSGKPISNARVALSPGDAEQLTGSGGNYEFTNLDPEPQYTVSVHHADYKTDRRTVTLKVGDSTLINFLLVSE